MPAGTTALPDQTVNGTLQQVANNTGNGLITVTVTVSWSDATALSGSRPLRYDTQGFDFHNR